VRRGRLILLLADRYSQSHVAQVVGVRGAVVRQWARRFLPSASQGWSTRLAAAPRALFPPEVAIYVVHLACEHSDILGRRLSPWDGHERARQLMAEGIVEEIAAATVRRTRAAPQLKPWRPRL
jgi:hypothetical protein